MGDAFYLPMVTAVVLLEERRTRIKAEIHQLLVNHQMPCIPCQFGMARAKQYKHILSSNLWGPVLLRLRPIRALIREVESGRPSLAEYTKDLTPRGSCAGPRCKVDGTSMFADKVEELEVASALSYAAAIRLEQAAAGGKE